MIGTSNDFNWIMWITNVLIPHKKSGCLRCALRQEYTHDEGRHSYPPPAVRLWWRCRRITASPWNPVSCDVIPVLMPKGCWRRKSKSLSVQPQLESTEGIKQQKKKETNTVSHSYSGNVSFELTKSWSHDSPHWLPVSRGSAHSPCTHWGTLLSDGPLGGARAAVNR